MSVTIVFCGEEGCGQMLNGELCYWFRVGRGGKPYCNEHSGRYIRFEEMIDRFKTETQSKK